ncbi:MAG: HEAT repeat domain-containing protein, partial [Prevotella sp.]|nr:HEAT repeat domain-containing protein [Prevotella sp.]
IFDACYNGDFREKDYIAGRYIFSEGKSVVAFANSVNVLQDKQANEMLGLLGLGARVGQWAQLTNILESHVIGDPTFRFTSNDTSLNLSELISRPYDEAEALRNVDSPYADVQNLALHQLYRNGYAGISDLLAKKYRTSPYAVVRYTSLALLTQVNDRNLQEILKESIHDSNEFIRRTTVRFMAYVGLNDYVPLLVKEYAENYFSERERFDIGMKMRVFDEKVVKKAVEDVLAHSYVTDRKELAEVLLKENEYKTSADEHIFDKTGKKGYRISYINSLKNENIHASVDGFLKLILDADEEEKVRCALLESLAWFKWSYRRQDIMNACQQLMSNANTPATVREYAERTYFRLK